MGLSSVFFIVAMFAETAAVVPDVITPPVQAQADKVICKRMPITGSLASSVKVCRTAHEWALTQETARSEGRRLLSTRASPDGF